LLEYQNFFAASLIAFKVPTKLFSDLYPAKIVLAVYKKKT